MLVFFLAVFLEFLFRVERLAAHVALVIVFVLVVVFSRHGISSHSLPLNNAVRSFWRPDCHVRLCRRCGFELGLRNRVRDTQISDTLTPTTRPPLTTERGR